MFYAGSGDWFKEFYKGSHTENNLCQSGIGDYGGEKEEKEDRGHHGHNSLIVDQSHN